MIAALLLVAAALQLALRLAAWPSLASRLLPVPFVGPPFLAWAGRLWISFALPAFIGLLLLGRPDALWRVPQEFAPAAAIARSWGRIEWWPIITGLLIGSMLSAIIARSRARRGKRPLYLGRPGRLPLTARELPAGAALALSAGVAEELYFRLLLPLLVALVSGSALLGVGASALIFGALHRHQGRVGVVATALAGLFLHFIYLGSGHLWLAMLAHALIDLNGLVVRPALGFGSPAAR